MLNNLENFRRKQGNIYLGIILFVTFVCYWPTLKSGFVNNDDNLHLYDNASVRALDGAHIKSIFTKPFNPTYVPLTALSFAVEYHFFKYQPFIYHFDNLLLHLSVTALIFYFALQLGLPLFAAFVAGLLFGIHPMHVESVAWVTERKDVLYSFFYMLALCFYWKYLEKRQFTYYVATMIFGILSILAKSMALSLPLIFLLCDWYKKRCFNKWMLLDKIPHFLYIVPISLMTYLLNARNPIQQAGEAIVLWVWCLMFYFYKFLFPVDLVLFYRFPKPFSLSTPEFAISFLSLGLLIYAIWRFRRQRLFIFAILFYFLSIFFLLRFDDIKYLPPVSNRFLYLPSLGFCFLIGYGADQLLKRMPTPNLRWFATACLVFITILLSAKSFVQTSVWKSSIAFWSHELKYYPDNAMALVNRGEAYKDEGKYALAFADFNKAVAVDPVYPEGYNSRGQMYGAGGQTDAALADFLKVTQLSPRFDEAYNNLGIIYAMKQDKKNALLNFQKAVDIDPSNSEAHFNLGDFYYAQGNFNKAFEHFQKVLSLNPNSAMAYNKRGLIFGIKQQYDLALRDFNRSLSIDPRNGEVYAHRGIVFEQKRMLKEALENYNAAIKLNPRYADAYYGRGNVYATMGLFDQAAKDFSKALAINPQHGGAQKNLQALNKKLKHGSPD